MNEDQTAPEPSTPETAPAIKCDQCDETFVNPLGLRVHKARKHGSSAAMAKWNRAVIKNLRPKKAKAQVRLHGRPKQSREEKLAKMREYSAERRAKAKALKAKQSPSMTPEYKRAYYLKKKEEKQRQQAQPTIQSNGPAQAAPAPACPNFCPNCGFGLAVVSVAMTIPNNR